jgi:PAS domain S-box-containing protein
MKKREDRSEKRRDLRSRAEKLLAEQPENFQKIPADDIRELINELQVHQIELEMQNEELRRAQTELEESQKRYLDLYHFAPVGYFTVGDNGLILEANLTGATMLGVERSALIGKPFYQFIAWEDRDIFYLHTRQLLEQGFRQTCELKIAKNDGTEFFGQLESMPVQDIERNSKKLQTALIDITERKRAVEALRESEAYVKGILKAAPVGIGLVNDRVVSWVNEQFSRMLGYSRDELIGKNARIVYENEAEFRRVGRAKYGQINDKGFGAVDTRLKGKDGKLTDVHLCSVPLDPADRSKGVIFAALDITQTRKMLKALEESEKKYRRLFEMESDALFLIETETGQILEVNTAGEELYGYGHEEFLQMKDSDLWAEPGETRAATAEQRTNLPVSYHRKKDGTLFPVDITSTFFTLQGREVHVAAIRDITLRIQAEAEKKKLEAQIQQSQRMEAIGTLAGGIAHDFNNLLMGIQGRASIMLMDSDSSHPHFEHLKSTEEYIRRAADLTNQLLGYARGGKYQVRPTDLNEMIKRNSEIFGRTKKEITIHRRLQKDIWTVEIDRGQIEQVLLNLYLNASQSMPAGGDLYVRTGNITLDESDTKPFDVEPGKFVKISVTDTGVGMDKGTQERIFDPFFTTKEMGRGTGLGLASVYGIIKNHGGIIYVYSEKGHGSTFSVLLPASEKEVTEERVIPEAILKGEETILLVDDEKMILDVGQEMLGKMGYNVLLARGGRDAVKVYRQNQDKIDIVILDIIMPDTGGGETYDKIKEINPKIKVLLSSGHSIDGQATELLEKGCNGFIQKPFNIGELSHQIRAILDK